MRIFSRCLAIGLIAWVPSLKAAVQLPLIFGNGMVLQQNKPLPVWGTAVAGEKVTVEFSGQTKTATADADGKWMLRLDPVPASADPKVFTVSGTDSKVTFQDVVVGEVWFCSGQSNMAFSLGGLTNFKELQAKPANPNLRYFSGRWARGAGADCSAVAYFFERDLQEKLGVPVAVIVSAVGGTPAEYWVDHEAQMADPELGPDAKIAVDKATKDAVTAAEYADKLKAFVAAYPEWEKANGRVPTDDAKVFAAFATGAEASPQAKTATLPQPLAALGFPDGGVYWLRKEVDFPDSISGPQLLTFQAKDLYEVYFNGTKIAGNKIDALSLQTPISYQIPANLIHPGKSFVALRVIDDTGSGGLLGPAGSIKLGSVSLADGWEIQQAQAYPKLSAEAAARPTPPPVFHPTSRPGCLFDRCVKPFIPYAIAGVIWYQGESNVGNSWVYRTLFPLLITDWRKHWGDETLPFYFCQIANYTTFVRAPREDKMAELRDAQLQTLKLPHTGQAVLIDLGEEGNIHPQQKEPAGDRLALIALNQTYQKGGEYSGPLYEGMKMDGDKIRLSFTHLGGGLVAQPLPETYVVDRSAHQPVSKPMPRNMPDSQLEGFQICGADKAWNWADAKIDGDQVVVSSPKVPNPVAVRYAWSANPICNLYNKAGLPASPFRTDDFPLTAPPKAP